MNYRSCQYCNKEFEQRKDSRVRSFCDIRCQKKWNRMRHKEDAEYRDVLGLPEARFCSGDKKVESL